MKKGFSILLFIVILGVFGLVVAGVAYFSSRANVPSEAESLENVTSGGSGFPENSKYQPQANQAEVKTANVNLQSGQVSAGSKSVPVSVNFADPKEVISGVGIRLIYNGEPNDGVSVSGITIAPNIVASSSWQCPVKLSSVVNGKVVVDLACVNISPEGYKAAGETLLATFNLNRTNGQFIGPVEMQIDPKVSAIIRKSDGKNVLNISGVLKAE